MNNKKEYYYSISWQQSYENWPSCEWVDEALNSIVEAALENSDYAEARRVIEQVKQ